MEPLPPTDPVEDLLERAIAELERNPGFDLEGLLRSSPEEAMVVRDKLAKLRAHGMIGSRGSDRGDALEGAVPDAEPTGSRIGRYEILGLIGRGGMGAVYRCLDHQLDRQVALKLVSLNGAAARSSEARRSALDRFFAEARITARLDHPNVVPVHETGTAQDGRLYFTMKLVEGETLRAVIDQLVDGNAEGSRAHSMASRIEIVSRVCSAVSYAHARGIVHRDLKPENVMLGAFGEVYVMDWGIARLRELALAEVPGSGDPTRDVHQRRTMTGDVFGTPSFMAPEQARGETDRVDERTDVFGLGAILYYLLSGLPPYWGSDLAAVLHRSREGRLNDPEMRRARRAVPAALRAVCRKALAPLPDDRYPSARAMAEDLEAFLADRQGSAWRDPLVVRAAKLVRRHPTRSAVVAALAVLFPLALFASNQRELHRLEAEQRATLQQQGIDAETAFLLEELRDRSGFETGSGTIDHARAAERYLELIAERVVPIDDERPIGEVSSAFAALRQRAPEVYRVAIDSLYDYSLMLYSALIAHGVWLDAGHPVELLDPAQKAAAREAVALHPKVAAAWPRLEAVIDACDEDPWRRETWRDWVQVLRGEARSEVWDRHLARANLATLDARNLVHLAGLTHTLLGAKEAEKLYRLAESDEWSLFWPHIFLGLIAYEHKDLQEARRQFEVARALNPGSGRVHLSLCGVYGELEDLARSSESGRKAVELIPDSPRAHFNLGLALARRTEFGPAIEELERALELDPSYFRAWNYLGQVLGATQRFDEAILAYEEARHLDPDSAEALTGQGHVHWQRSELKDALELYERATLVDPDCQPGWNGTIKLLGELQWLERQLVTELRAQEKGRGNLVGPEHMEPLREKVALLLQPSSPPEPILRAWLATARMFRGEVLCSVELFDPIVAELISAEDPNAIATLYGQPATVLAWRACQAAARAATGEGYQFVEGRALLEPGDPDLLDENGSPIARMPPSARPPLSEYFDQHPEDADRFAGLAADCLELWLALLRADSVSSAPRFKEADQLSSLREVAREQALQKLRGSERMARALVEVEGWIRELEAGAAGRR